jgi:hypothetical protein
VRWPGSTPAPWPSAVGRLLNSTITIEKLEHAEVVEHAIQMSSLARRSEQCVNRRHLQLMAQCPAKRPPLPVSFCAGISATRRSPCQTAFTWCNRLVRKNNVRFIPGGRVNCMVQSRLEDDHARGVGRRQHTKDQTVGRRSTRSSTPVARRSAPRSSAASVREPRRTPWTT